MIQLSKRFIIEGQKTFYCEICYCDAELDTIAYLNCGHYYCRDCLRDYFNCMIKEQKSATKLKCPSSKCENKINGKEVKELCGAESHAKFKKFIGNYLVASSDNKCFCPLPNCEGVNNKAKGTAKVTCLVCH